MSYKGNIYDNAFTESFYRTQKESLFEVPITTHQNKPVWTFLNILNPYNNTNRMHSALDYLAPVDFELLNFKKLNFCLLSLDHSNRLILFFV